MTIATPLQNAEDVSIVVDLLTTTDDFSTPKEVIESIKAARAVFIEMLEEAKKTGEGKGVIGSHEFVPGQAMIILHDQADIDWTNSVREQVELIIGITDLTPEKADDEDAL